MANGRSIKTDGWKDLGSPEVEATVPVSATAASIEPASSAAPVSLDVSWHGLMTLHTEVLGKPKWREFNEGRTDLSDGERQGLLEAALGDLPLTVENVRALHEALRVKNAQGWSLTDFPVFRVAADYIGLSAVLETEETTFQTALLAELSSRGA